MKRVAFLLALSLFAFSSGAMARKSWTILVYLNGDNDLWSAAVEDLNEMEAVGSTADVDIVVQIDLPERAFGIPPFNDTRRYFVEQDPAGESDTIVSTLVWPESGTRELDMGSPGTLADFVRWGVDNYPAERYALIIWDHGDGWKFSPSSGSRRALKEVSDDITSGTSISISGGELQEAMDSIRYHLGRKLDLIGLDACLLGMWEVDVVLKDYADFIVHSEETEDEDGYDYAAMMNTLASSPLSTPEELCSAVAQGSIDSVGSTLSCVNLNLISAVSTAIDAVAAQVMDAMDTMEDELQTSADLSLRFSDGEFGDLHHFMELLAASSTLPESLTTAAARLRDAVETAVVRNEARGRCAGAGGISIYFPVSPEYNSYDEDYTEGAGALWADYLWDEMICSFSCLVCSPDAYEPDDSSADAKEIGPEDPFQKRSLYPLNDTDIAFARVWKGLDYTFFTEGNLDTYMWIISAGDFHLIAESDDEGEEKNAFIEWSAEFDGAVYVKIQHWGTTVGWGARTGAYTLNTTWGECDPLELPICLYEGVCEGTLRVCEDGAWLCPYPETWEETDRSCNNVDNDCDGRIDEDYQPYECGLGECRVESTCTGGIETCIPLDPPSSEDTLCDGRDEDCDGEVDEEADCGGCDPADRPECLQSGVCEGAHPVCRDGRWACNYPASYSSTDDTCDGLDNNCNGLIDEGADCGKESPLFVTGSGLSCSIALVR